MTTATNYDPLGHLAPFVLEIAKKKIAAGGKFDQAMLKECVAQAVEEDNERCEMMLRFRPGRWNLKPNEHAAVVKGISEAVYESIPKGKPQMNPRWLALEKHLGRRPTSIEFLTNQPLVTKLMANT